MEVFNLMIIFSFFWNFRKPQEKGNASLRWLETSSDNEDDKNDKRNEDSLEFVKLLIYDFEG